MKREQIHQAHSLGDAIADRTAAGIGSWTFIIAQAIFMIIWFILNTATWFLWKWDIYPFIFLNLAMSAEAAFSAPIIMMSQNRQADKDRKRDDMEATEVQDLFENHKLLLDINQQQLEILQLLKEKKQ